jgi:hypothetical protein
LEWRLPAEKADDDGLVRLAAVWSFEERAALVAILACKSVGAKAGAELSGYVKI